MKKGLQKLLTYLLVSFALVSIGYSLGKNHQPKQEPVISRSSEQKSIVQVYYLHSTFRCDSCNQIETMTRQLVDSKYQSETASGKLEFIEMDFQENEALAEKYEVTASCVVISLQDKGKDLAFERVDEVWTLKENQEKFDLHLQKVIDQFLVKQEELS